MLVADALDHDGFAVLVALNIERAAGANRYASSVRASFDARGHLSPHHVTSAKTVDTLVSHQVAPWKAKFVQPCALVTASACGFEC